VDVADRRTAEFLDDKTHVFLAAPLSRFHQERE
jgi:hypothetical protein